MDGSPDSEKRGLFDPVFDALDNMKSGIRPDSLGSMAGGSKENNKKNTDKNAGAADKLSSMEKSAGGGVGNVGKGLDGINKLESSAPGNIINSVKGKLPSSNSKGTGKGKGFFKKGGPVAAILGLMLGAGALIGGSQALMPFSLLSQFQETFDTINVSTSRRSDVMLRKQLAKDDVKDPIRKKYFGFGDNKFKVSSKQKSKLKKQGIYIDDDFGGTGKTAMLFDDGSGKLKVVAASDTDIEVFKKVDTNKINLSNLDTDIDLADFDVDVDSAITFKNAYMDVPDFRNGYIKSSKTWRGSVGAWFDSVTVKFLQSNKLTRNRFKDFQERVKAESDGNTRSAAKKATTDLMEADAEDLKTKTGRYESELDADGNETGNLNKIDNDTDIKTKGATKAEIKAKMNEIKNGKLGKASGYASAIANVACTVFDVIGAINLLIVAQETIQVLQVTTSYFEAIDKVKAGDGNDSPINVLAEGLTTPKATTVMKNSTDDVEILERNEDVDINEITVEGKESTSAMQSAGITALYSGKPINTNDESVQNFNIGARFSTILGYFGNSIMSFAGCAVAKAAAAAADAVIDLISIVTCVASLGVGCIVNALGEAAVSGGASIAIGLAATFAINIITPLAVKAFTRDLVSDLGGEDLGNAITSGANIYMGNNHLNGGGSLATRDKYIAFAQQQQNVIAEEAKFERETKNPFDATSQYTFMGNLVKQMATMYTIKSPIFGGLGTVGKILSNSVTALLPSATAYDIASTVKAANDEEFSKNCPYLSSIGAVGDAFCNPYMITDVSTIEEDPFEVVDRVEELGGIDSEGNIEKSSNLAKYVSYCSQRGSSFGVADGNIASNFSGDVDTGNGTANTVVNGAVGMIPVVGDIVDVVSNSNQLANTGWITGQSCVASDDGLIGDGGVSLGVSWDENKYYQRFVEDQRYLEGIDPNYKSAVTAFLDDYYQENPLDTSYEGILARKSGLSKDTVVALLDTINYWNYIANYVPSERYAFGEPVVKMEHKLRFDSDYQIADDSIITLMNQVVYPDIRNRNFAV